MSRKTCLFLIKKNQHFRLLSGKTNALTTSNYRCHFTCAQLVLSYHLVWVPWLCTKFACSIQFLNYCIWMEFCRYFIHLATPLYTGIATFSSYWSVWLRTTFTSKMYQFTLYSWIRKAAKKYFFSCPATKALFPRA